jgi:hypothetical protein
MKVSDESLTLMVWHYQLKSLARRVLHNYVGGLHGVCAASWFEQASYISMPARQNITKCLGTQQLRSRLLRLIRRGVFVADRFSCFHLDNAKAREAFEFARAFWIGNGVPSDVVGSQNPPVKVENLQELAAECEALLMDKFRQLDWDTVQPLVGWGKSA